ncbi:MFS transporter [Nonomuraea sp. NPDC046570]|uniref:MFS transporter n=1 Tax=Nonomuraea sp. NPDC046570 TaxID=3155255 RepID=UPI0033F31F7A
MTGEDAPMGLRRFRAVFADRRVRWAAAGAVTGRLAQTIMPLALLLAGQKRLHDFAAAGAVVAMYALVSAVGAPAVGRLIDRWGVRALVGFAAISGAATVGLATSRTATGMIGFAAVAGVSTPPLGASLRAVVVRVLPQPIQAAALSLDSVATEVLFIVGPTVAGVAAAIAAPSVALFGCAALMLLGAVVFIPSAAGGSPHTAQAGRRPLPSVAVLARLLPVLAMTTALTFTIGVIEVSVTARAAEWQSIESAGALLGFWALGSVVGGLIYGSRDWPGSPRGHALLLLPAMGLGFAALALAGNVAAMYPLMVLAGLGVAPALTNLARLVASQAPAGRDTEAFAWFGASTALGGAAGVAVAGAVVDRWSAGAGLVTAATLTVATTVLVPVLRSKSAPGGAPKVTAPR